MHSFKYETFEEKVSTESHRMHPTKKENLKITNHYLVDISLSSFDKIMKIEPSKMYN